MANGTKKEDIKKVIEENNKFLNQSGCEIEAIKKETKKLTTELRDTNHRLSLLL